MKCVCTRKYICKGLILFIIIQIVFVMFIFRRTYVRTESNGNKVGIHEMMELIHVPERKLITEPQMALSSTQNTSRKMNGYQLADTVHKTCVSHYYLYTAPRNRMHFINNGKIKMCPVEKIGSTFWRRVFAILTTAGFTKFKTPFDILPGVALQQRRKFSYNYTDFHDSEFSFMFVRNPWSRLLSTFIDKLVPPNPFYWKALGKDAVQKFRHPNTTNPSTITGHDVTFSEFVQYVIYMEKSMKVKDGHVQSLKLSCQACNQSYSFIGRMEQFKDDSFDVLKEMGLSDVVEKMNTTFETMSAKDAIHDTIRDAFIWKRHITKIISWDKALSRLWLKLQMRGLVSEDIKLRVSGPDVHRIKTLQFIDMAKIAHLQSDPLKLKLQKERVKKEAFDSVPLSVLKHFANVYMDDFMLFGYEPYPSKYFDRDEEPEVPSKFFNYSHLN